MSTTAMALLETLRREVSARITTEGQTSTAYQGLCVQRFAKKQVFSKAPALGVTLGVVLEGKKTIRVAGQELDVEPGRFVVFTREIEFESATRGTPYLGLSLCLSPELVARALVTLSEAGGTHAEEAVPAFMLPADEEVVAALLRLWRAAQEPLERKVLAPLAAEEIVFRLLRSDAAAAMRAAIGHAADASRILEAMHYVRSNLNRSFSVSQLARQVAMSPSHFAHRFRAVARVTPMRYARDARLEHARTLLTGGARASDVAARSGFESAAHFSREFKRRFGVAPTLYVRRLNDI